LPLQKNEIVKGTTLPYCDICKYTWTSDEKTRNQIDHILIDE